jgi:hypothetical protein
MGEFNGFVRDLKVRYPPSFSDILRIFVLQEHGGIWFDLSTILHDDNMDWIDDLLGSKQYMVTNNYS